MYLFKEVTLFQKINKLTIFKGIGFVNIIKMKMI